MSKHYQVKIFDKKLDFFAGKEQDNVKKKVSMCF